MADQNISHRSLQGSVAVSLGRDGSSSSTTANGEDPLSILRFFDVVLVVDDSSSMHVTEDSPDNTSRWDEARVALEGVAGTVARYDSDGMDIVFLNSEAEGRAISSPAEVRKLFDSVDPNGQTPTGERLAMLFLEYWDILDSWSDKKKAGTLTADDAPPKKRNYIVLTDGRPSDDLASVIVDCARRLDQGDYPLSQLNIQFIQVGADREATKSLEELDSQLEHVYQVRDIVDILAYRGGNLQAADIMQQLHGGIFKRSKGIEEETAHVRELVQDTPAAAAVVAKGILTEEEVQADEVPVATASAPAVVEQDEDEDEEEQAVTIPLTADGIPDSHPDADKLNEALSEVPPRTIARAASAAGLGTAVGAGVAELVPTDGAETDVPVETEPTTPAELVEEAEEFPSSAPEVRADESSPVPAEADADLEGPPAVHAAERAPEAAESSSIPATEPVVQSRPTFSLLGKNLKLTTEEDAKEYCDELEAMEGVEEIHLGGNTLGQGACEAFARALQSSRSSLRIFNGADIFTARLITEIPASLKALCDGLVGHEKLKEVDLSDNAFGGRCADAMTGLFSNNHSIEVIKLQNNGLGISGGKIIAAALEAAADKLDEAGQASRLRSVTIGRNRLENGSAPDIARALARHGKSIEEVRVPQNGIRMQGVEELCQQLSAHCPNLRSLDIQDNTLVQRGSRALAAAIPSWPQLESLNLSDSLVRSTGAKWIFDALAQHSSGLHTLLLQYCELNRGALASLADNLDSSLPNLKHIELNGNWADEDDEFITRIKSAVESRGGDVELLGLDELELEAEEEEEPEEDYEDSEEEEEEEEEEADEVQVKKDPSTTEAPVTIERVAEHDEPAAEVIPAEEPTVEDESTAEVAVEEKPVEAADESEAEAPQYADADTDAEDDEHVAKVNGKEATYAAAALAGAVGALSINEAKADSAAPAPVAETREVSAGKDLPESAFAPVAETREVSEVVEAQAEEDLLESKPATLPEIADPEPVAPSKTFSLLGKNLKLNDEEDAKPYCDELSAIEGLEEIHLGGNTLGQGACEAFARALQSSRSSLRIFNGADIFTGRLITEIPASLKALCDGLVGHQKLEEVDLSDNAFGGRCADAMTELFSNNHSIEVIKLQNNGLGISGGKIIAAALEAAADKLDEAGQASRLRSVTIGRNRLENGSAPDIARALARHGKSIEEVRVPQNGIRMQGVEELCQQLSAHCPNLRSLDIQDNTLVQRGSRALAAAIPSWPQLESLNLSDSLVRSTGAKWIFDALAQHSSGLNTLLLQYCELNRGALASLADNLDSSLPNLKHIELNGNWADEDDEFIARIKSAVEARGGDVDLLGLDELELEAEEEEEPEEDYEDSEEEEEEEEEEEVAKEEKSEVVDAPVLTQREEVAAEEPHAASQTEADAPQSATDDEEPSALSTGNAEVESSAESEASGTKDEDVSDDVAMEETPGQATVQSEAMEEADQEPVSAQSQEDTSTDADLPEPSHVSPSHEEREVEDDAQEHEGGVVGAALGAVASLGAAVGAISLSDNKDGDKDAISREVSAASEEESVHHNGDIHSSANVATAAKEVPEDTIEKSAAEEHTRSDVISHSKAAVHDEGSKQEAGEEEEEHAGLDAAAAAVAVPAGMIDMSVQMASATGKVVHDKAEEQISEVAPNVALGLPLEEVASAAGAPSMEVQVEEQDGDSKTKSTKTVGETLGQALEGAKTLVPDVLSGGEGEPSVSGEGFALGDAVENPDSAAPKEVDDNGSAAAAAAAPTTTSSSRSGGIFEAIKSAATGGAVASLLPTRSGGGVSGEGLDSSALPTPAVERSESQLAAEGTETGQGSGAIPSSESQTLSSKIQEALDDELPNRRRRGAHGRTSSIDLSGELYIDGDLSESRFEEIERQQGGPSLSTRVYAAFGAVWELMR
ncbi:hypothetical protein CF327_g6645 [Tilletia walkeri]|nr:hypothetical protein CF327_g6645 [Tilletia walkeri]